MNIDTKDITAETQQIEDNIRVAPHNLQAEQMLLGAVLVNNDLLNRFSDFLTEDHFYEPVHRRIFSAINMLNEKGMIANHVTLKNYFEKDEALQSHGGYNYLTYLASLASTFINVVDYAKLIFSLAVKRELILIGSDIVNEAYIEDINKDVSMQIENAEQSLYNLASEGNDGNGFRALKLSLHEAVERAAFAFKQKDKVSGISTGLKDLNGMLGGFQNSDLVILAGRPSMGKTALAVNLALNSCYALTARYKQDLKKEKNTPLINEQPPSVGFFSLEMSGEQLASRMIAMISKINSSKIRHGDVDEEAFERLTNASKELQNLPFYIDDTPMLSISALRTRARRLKRKHNLAILFIDYLQLIRGVSKTSDNRVQEVSEITQGLKAIAKELNIPVIALSQLSRAVEQRENKRPMLSDLRESGSIEQDADIVMFIYRDEYYVERAKPGDTEGEKFRQWNEQKLKVKNMAEIIIAKHRNGAVGEVMAYFHPDTTKFEDVKE